MNFQTFLLLSRHVESDFFLPSGTLCCVYSLDDVRFWASHLNVLETSSVFGFFDVLVGLFQGEDPDGFDFFYFSRHVRRELCGASYVCRVLKLVFHFVAMSFKRRGHFAKETLQNFVVKWLCSLDFFNCHDARWNALLNLCWLMCACVSMARCTLHKYTNKDVNVWLTLCKHRVVVHVLTVCFRVAVEGTRICFTCLKPGVRSLYVDYSTGFYYLWFDMIQDC